MTHQTILRNQQFIIRNIWLPHLGPHFQKLFYYYFFGKIQSKGCMYSVNVLMLGCTVEKIMIICTVTTVTGKWCNTKFASAMIWNVWMCSGTLVCLTVKSACIVNMSVRNDRFIRNVQIIVGVIRLLLTSAIKRIFTGLTAKEGRFALENRELSKSVWITWCPVKIFRGIWI